MLYPFKCGDPSRAPVFETGWFVETIMTQTLVIHIIRTDMAAGIPAASMATLPPGRLP
jgi:hypothetical protein